MDTPKKWPLTAGTVGGRETKTLKGLYHMCFFEKTSLELFPEKPRHAGDYYQHDENDLAHRQRMVKRRAEIAEANRHRNQKAKFDARKD